MPPGLGDRSALLHKRSNLKRRLTNVIKRITSIESQETKSAYDYVYSQQCLDEVRDLNHQFQEIHEAASLLVYDDEELLELDYQELESHDDRVSLNISKLLFIMKQQNNTSQSDNVESPRDAQSTNSKGKRSSERKWKRVRDNVNNVLSKIHDAQTAPENHDLEDLVRYQSLLTNHTKSLDEIVSEIESLEADLDDPDGDNWKDIFVAIYDKIHVNEENLSHLIKLCRRNEKSRNEDLAKKQEEERKQREHEVELQNQQHKEELQALVAQIGTVSNQRTVKLPELKIPEFDGEPTSWKSYWQQFEATIHTSKKLDDQLRMQYLIKSLTTKKARDAIEGIDAVAEAYPEAVAALKTRFDRPQIIHRAHVRCLLNAKPVKEGSSQELRHLHDTLQHHLRSLKALGQLNFSQFITALGETKLDASTMVEWQKHCQEKKNVSEYEKLLEFLDMRATATELINFDTSSRRSNGFIKKPTFNSTNNQSFTKSVSTYSTETDEAKCTVCNGKGHRLPYCPQFKKKSTTEKRKIVMEERVCFNCLRSGHAVKDCTSEHRCRKCDQSHHTLLHVDNAQRTPVSTSALSTPASNQSANHQDGATSTNSYTSYVAGVAVPDASSSSIALMMTAEILVTNTQGNQTLARALLDPASSASFVTERIAQQLQLPRQRQAISISGIGGLQCPNLNNSVVQVNLTSKHDSTTISQVSAIVLPSLTKRLPVETTQKGDWPHLASLKLADPDFNISKPIDILLGIDVYHEILKPGIILGPKNTPAAQETIFGWVLFGNTATTAQPPKGVTTLHALTGAPSCEELLQKFWSLEETPSASPPLTMTDKTAIQSFNDGLSREVNGRFVVKLPFKQHHVTPLGESRPQALRRFLSLERRLHRSKEYNDYAKVVNTYFSSNHAEKVPDVDMSKDHSRTFYLAHHAVYKESSTTPLRVVFDGSMKSTTGVSINDLLLVGPTVHPPLNDVLLRFRQHPYVLTTDVSKMYRGVGLNPDDRDYHRFLWRNSPDEPISDYRMTRVTFGIASSAFLATNTMLHLAEENRTELPLAYAAVKESFYVDDGLISVPSKQEAILLHQQLQELFSRGGFTLHKWNSNSRDVLETISSELCSQDPSSRLGEHETFIKALGIEYDATQDNFKFSATDLVLNNDKLTKRLMLSDSSKIFDPLGLISCVTIVVKILFQRLWEEGVDWDDALPPDLQRDWLTWREGLPVISSLRIPRCYTPLELEVVSKQLIGFCDASERAYCGIVYLRSVDTAGGVHTSIVTAKTKVTPIRKVTLPRLELCGARLLSKLLKHAQDTLSIPSSDIRAFTDSTIVLYWIHGSSQRFKTFEANRISEIQELVPPELWSHVSGKDNPADVGSRGILPQDVLNHDLWWHGSTWLKNAESDWPHTPAAPRPSLESLVAAGVDANDLQIKAGREVTSQTVTATPVLIDVERFSSYSRLLRVTARVFRVATRTHLFKDVPIASDELRKAETWLVKQAQYRMFPSVIEALKDERPLAKSDSLQLLNPFLDSDGLLRVGGRISQSNQPYQARHPLILKGKDHLASLIIQNEHQRLCHGGPKLLLGSLQERYHIIGARRVVRHWTHRCTVCRRASPKITTQLMGQLPAARVCPTFANEKVSVDYAGPVTIKGGAKRRPTYLNAYIAVFVCLETKACHLELVSDLTAEAFIAALRRFVARKGKPSQMWSDNGTQFTRANKDLKEFYNALKQQVIQGSINDFCSMQGIEWHFSPPTGPHHGSVWENGVKACKFHLKRIVGSSKLNFEELTTTLCQIEACLNSRPIAATLDANDDDGVTALTPGHFLIGRPMEAIPDPPDVQGTSINLLKRWKLCQTLTQHFWKRWSTEYLCGLLRFTKWRYPQRNLKVGDIVLMKDNRLNPGQWPLARITQVHPGPDNLVRVVTVKGRNGTYVRPIVKICLLLPMEEQA